MNDRTDASWFSDKNLKGADSIFFSRPLVGIKYFETILSSLIVSLYKAAASVVSTLPSVQNYKLQT